MTSSGLADNTNAAAMAFVGATEDAGNYIDSLMNQYGWTMPGSDGSYSVINSGNAFDPNNIMSFGDKGGATIDMARIANQTASGKFGGRGIFADIARGGATQEAQTVADLSSRGLGQGGLAEQQRALAEYTTNQQTGQASSELFNKLLAQYVGVKKAYQGSLGSNVTGSINSAISGSQYV